MPIGDWATVREAAEYYGVSRQRIHQLLQKGALGETRRANDAEVGTWLIRYPFQREVWPTGIHKTKRGEPKEDKI